MRLLQNSKAISGLALILLILASAIVGALLSYLWVVGYYENLKIRTPGKSDVAIINATFLPQDTSFFNVTILNPSYSPSDANITRIATSTEDGFFHNITEIYTSRGEPLPFQLSKATADFSGSETFKCRWGWANYTGETVGIVAFLADGSGPTFEAEIPFVDLRITDARFNSTLSAKYFNITVQNLVSSTTCNVTVDMTEISVTTEDGIKPNITEITPLLPWSLNPGESHDFTCTLDWAKYQNMNVTVTVGTSQGYTTYAIEETPPPVTLKVKEVLFDPANTTRFDFTVENNKFSPTYLNVTKIAVVAENKTVQEWTAESESAVTPPLPFTLNKNSSTTFLCPWNWTEYREKNATIVVHTLQGFMANHTQVTPPPVILEIIDVTFDPIDTKQFDFIVRNSEFSLTDTDIVEVFVIIEDGTVVTLTDYLDLPTPINRTQSINLTCPWDWGKHLGSNATIVVETEQGYSAYSDQITLTALTISGATFNHINTDYFIVTVQNPTLLSFTLTTIDVTVDAASSNVTDKITPPFPFKLTTGINYTFVCLWENWTSHQGKEVTITIETQYGYKAFYTCNIPAIP